MGHRIQAEVEQLMTCQFRIRRLVVQRTSHASSVVVGIPENINQGLSGSDEAFRTAYSYACKLINSGLADDD